MLATTDADIKARVAAVVPNRMMRTYSGMPPLAPFMPIGLLERIHDEVQQLGGTTLSYALASILMRTAG